MEEEIDIEEYCRDMALQMNGTKVNLYDVVSRINSEEVYVNPMPSLQHLLIASKGDDMEVYDISEKQRKFLSSLSTVGIENEMNVEPRFYPHSRSFNEIPELGEFYFKGEVVNDWYIPNLGAEKLSKSVLEQCSIQSGEVFVGCNSAVNIIECARPKLDGFEVVQFGIRTFSHHVFFIWDNEQLVPSEGLLPDAPRLFEKIGSSLIQLSGERCLCDRNEWYELNHTLLDQKECEEGIIIRMNAREYRVPYDLSATFHVKNGEIWWDGKQNLDMRIVDGFYDFKYIKGKWVYWKPRKDKTFADSLPSVKLMITQSVTIQDLKNRLMIPDTAGMRRIEKIKKIKKWKYNVKNDKPTPDEVLTSVFVRGSNLKDKNSVRARALELEGQFLDSWDLISCEANLFESSWRLIVIPRFKGTIRVSGVEYTGEQVFSNQRPIFIGLIERDNVKEYVTYRTGIGYYRVFRKEGNLN